MKQKPVAALRHDPNEGSSHSRARFKVVRTGGFQRDDDIRVDEDVHGSGPSIDPEGNVPKSFQARSTVVGSPHRHGEL
jgi:hypothetical protein